MKTYLMEFYDADYIENLISLLHKPYDGVYYFYFAEPRILKEKALTDYCKNHYHINPKFIKIGENSLEGIIEAFKSVLKKDSIYDFDITGGSELFSLAIGYLKGTYKDYNIMIHQYNVIDDHIVYHDSKQYYKIVENRNASIEEVVGLNGGKIINISEKIETKLQDNSYRNEIIKLFNALKTVPSEWNRFCSLSLTKDEFEEENEVVYYRRLSKDGDEVVANRIMAPLLKNNIVYKYSIIEKNNKKYCRYILDYSCKNEELYEKSGTYLENYTALAFEEAGLFREVCTSVKIDLNGVITNRPADPCNEIDVIAIYNHTPVFISCKNTIPTKEFLYEIKIISKQYGGKYAMAALVASRKSLEPVRQRAKEMGVILIDDVSEYSLSEFKNIIREKFPSY